ncbi:MULTISPECIES: hypothetical protein [Xanthomonas]|uniref:Uncharacterized protein n=2 Tax=Xanthomonas TaxID=338 RepID=A0A7Z7J376_XANCH|nr:MULTISPECIES: hypothetical protein [Xanthomonas]ATS38403.1 hypothetical protein XcfCFBP6988P_09950 [Xanthomonas citri pv. phaseoli var. fuscans]ATS42797.1 hypothetical protein XcfCFBP6989P_10535 [Xanthomonas citri pv. phaseoli var. fuscans]ATS46403.1 hypothetical protein XcfCFBP6990P_06820 [Xanthomonas citri pv. phaseoli var. fuscans]ATS83339.1 hypothetical protein XcfCFBP6991P_04645 [Xanthomonas citri pv. phaseoli var. fuscans]QWN20063.1 hypothetical protein DGM98_07820 [Xanthomonas citri]
MLIGYGQPALAPSVHGATAINLAAMVDGRPASVARINGGGSSVRLRADWASPAQVGIVAILGVTCPAGTAVTLTGRRQGDAGYAYPIAAEVIRALVDESRAAWFILPANIEPLIGLQLEVAASNLDVGELAILQAVDVPIQVEWEASRVDPSSAERTLGGGLNVVPRRSYRRLQVALVPDQRAAVRGAALAQGTDWDRLTYALGGNARSAVIPRWGVPGAINRDELHRTALFGRFTPGSIAHRGGDYYASNGWIFEEIPPL